MTNRLHTALCFLFAVSFYLSAVSLTAQTFPGASQEVRPTPKNPTYRPESIPPYLKKRSATEAPAQQFFANPDGSGDDLSRLIQKPKEEKPSAIEESRLESEFQQGRDRAYLERTYLPQFGWRIDPDSHNPFYGEPHYTETKFDRGRNIFFLSAPFTYGLSYGLVSAYRNGGGLNRPETMAVVGLGTILSALIVWHDYQQVWSKSTTHLDGFAKQLRFEDQHRAQNHQIVAGQTSKP